MSLLLYLRKRQLLQGIEVSYQHLITFIIDRWWMFLKDRWYCNITMRRIYFFIYLEEQMVCLWKETTIAYKQM